MAITNRFITGMRTASKVGFTPFFMKDNSRQQEDDWQRRQREYDLPYNENPRDYGAPAKPTIYNNERRMFEPLFASNRQPENDQFQDTNRGIVNYQTRISAIGEEVPEPEKKENGLIRFFNNLDRFRNATFVGASAVQDATKQRGQLSAGEAVSEFASGASRGFKREEELYGQDVLERMGVENKAAKIIGGLALDIAGDPLTYVTMGIGSMFKGAITGRGGTMAAETAESLARASLTKASRESVEGAVRSTLTNGKFKYTIGDAFKKATTKKAGTITTAQFEKMVKGKAFNEIQRVANLIDADALRNLPIDKFTMVDELWNAATKTLATLEQGQHALKARPGVSILGKQIGGLSNQAMQDVGANATKRLVDAGVPGLSRGVEVFQDTVNTVFRAHWMKGASAAQNSAFRRIVQDAEYSRHMMDEDLLGKTKNLYQTLKNTAGSAAEAAEIDKTLTRMIEGTLAPSDNEVVQKIMKTISDDFASWATEEQGSGVLKSVLEDYMPRVMNWDLPENASKHLAKGGMTRNMGGIVNVNAMKRQAGKTFDEAQQYMQFKTANLEDRAAFIKNLINTSTDEAKAKFMKSLNSAKIMDKALDFLDEVGSPGMAQDVIDDFLLNEGTLVNRALHHLDGVKDLNLVQSGIHNFFEESALRAYIQRGLSHNKVIADKQLIDQITGAFGQRVTGPAAIDSAARDGKTIVVKRSAFKAIGVDLDELKNTEVVIKRARKIAHGTGPDNVRAPRPGRKVKGQKIVPKTPPNKGAQSLDKGITSFEGEARALIKNLLDRPVGEAFLEMNPEQYKLLARYMPIEGYAFDPSIIKTVNAQTSQQIDAGIKSIGQAIDALHRAWKPAVTGWRPDYYIRNFFGDSFNTYIEQGFRGLNPKTQSAAVRLASGQYKPSDTIKLGGKVYKMADIDRAYRQHHVNANFFRADAGNLTRELFEREVGRAGRDNLIKRAARQAKDTYIGATRNFGGKAEDYLRYTHFLSGLDRGMDFRRASELTKYFHFDYSDLSKTERTLIKRIIPFYTWARNNIPLQLETLLNDPTRHLSAHRMITNIEMAYDLDSENVPDWMQKGLALPLPMEELAKLPMVGERFAEMSEQGRTPYLNWGLPTGDLAMTPQDALGMISPFIKTPVELTINRSMRSGMPISRMPETRAQDRANYIMDQFGAARNIRRAIEGEPPPEDLEGRVTNPMFGAIPYTAGLGRSNMLLGYSPEQSYLRSRYDYSRQLGNRVQYLKSQGLPVPDVGDADAFKNLTPEQLEMVRRTGFVPFFMR